jgi:hypothetical protein
MKIDRIYDPTIEKLAAEIPIFDFADAGPLPFLGPFSARKSAGILVHLDEFLGRQISQ